MKQLVLTGLATEQKFGKQEAQYYLVFNDGDLRVPVSEEAAQIVVKEMYQEVEEAEEPETGPVDSYDNGSDYVYRSETSSEDEDDGIAQI